MRKTNYVTFYIFCLILALSGCGNGKEQFSSTTGLMKGQIAPDFTLNDLNGNHVSLSSFKNKSAVCLTFWATWCPYCTKEIPRFKEIYTKYYGKGVKVLSINVASNDPIKRVKAFQNKYEIPYTVLYDENNLVSRLYGVQGIPVTLLIDRQGIIQYRGYQLPDNTKELLEQML